MMKKTIKIVKENEKFYLVNFDGYSTSQGFSSRAEAEKISAEFLLSIAEGKKNEHEISADLKLIWTY
ncbi:MAG TPA: hypothetical protein ENG95_05885 [Nitrospirae bacterium]|nr:hypothetical protein [Nitrospirota bacterium]